jgi:hypothetical protein
VSRMSSIKWASRNKQESGAAAPQAPISGFLTESDRKGAKNELGSSRRQLEATQG